MQNDLSYDFNLKLYNLIFYLILIKYSQYKYMVLPFIKSF